MIQVQPDWSYVVADDGGRGFVPTAKVLCIVCVLCVRIVCVLCVSCVCIVYCVGGFINLTLWLPKLATPRGSSLVAKPTQVSLDVITKHWYANMMEDYQAEMAEALTLAANTRCLVLHPGEDWTYVEHNGEKGFVPTPLLKVNGKEDILSYCKRQAIPVAPAGSVTTDTSSEGRLSKDLGEELDKVRKLRAGEPGTALTEGGVRVVKTPESVIPAPVWSRMADADRHRQRMIYGLIHAEFLYNKQLWALNQIAKEFRAKQQRLLSNDERDALFRDTDAIYALSNTMLASFLKRWEASPQGVVGTVADILEQNLHAFEAYLRFCSRERRVMQQQIFLEHKSFFGHPFNVFLEELASKSADLEALVGKPAQYLEMWPMVLRNLMKDTSRSRQEEEYNALRKLKRYFTSLVADLRHDSHALRSDLNRRFENYASVEPHLRGRRLLKESPAKVVSGAGVDYGNHTFLFDSCIVFARRASVSAQDEERGAPVFKALKMVKLVGLRIVDVQKGTITVRTGGDRYFIALPNASVAVEWRNLISYKSYRHELGEISEDGGQDDEAHVRLPTKSPAYDAHVSRVRKMQNYISGLLNEVPPPLPETGAGKETLALRAGADATRPTSSYGGATTTVTSKTSTTKPATTNKPYDGTITKLPGTRSTLPPAGSHFESDDDDERAVAAPVVRTNQQPAPLSAQQPQQQRPPQQQQPPKVVVVPAPAATRSPQPPPAQKQRDLTDSDEFESGEWEEEEDETGEDTPNPPLTTAAAATAKPFPASSRVMDSSSPATPPFRKTIQAENYMTPLSTAILGMHASIPETPAPSMSMSSTFANNNTTVAAGTTTKPQQQQPQQGAKRSAESQDSDELSSTTTTQEDETGRRKGFKAPQAMYKTLTGQLENIISQGHTTATKDSDEDDPEKDSDEWEEEEVSVTDSDTPNTGKSATRSIPAATPMPQQPAQTPSFAVSAIPNKAGGSNFAAGDASEDEDEEEGEWETVSEE